MANRRANLVPRAQTGIEARGVQSWLAVIFSTFKLNRFTVKNPFYFQHPFPYILNFFHTLLKVRRQRL
jgi:hypothetical protein